MGKIRTNWVRLGTSALLWAFVSALTISTDNASLLQLRDDPIDDSADAGFAPENYTACNYNAKYDSLFDLNTAIAGSAVAAGARPIAGGIGKLTGGGTMRSECIVAYGLQALIKMMDTAYDNYTSMNKDGYDKDFDYYIKYMEKTVPEVIDGSLMFDTSKATDTMAMAPVGPGMKCNSFLFAFTSYTASTDCTTIY